MSLPQTLDEEFKRISKQEDIPMADLVEEVSRITGYTTRQIYNFRSGKWPLPASIIPILCKRFSSRTLLQVLAALCEQTPVTIPDEYDLARFTTQAVRDDMGHYQLVLSAFEDGCIDKDELAQLRESSDRVCERIWMFYEIAAADYDRRRPQPK